MRLTIELNVEEERELQKLSGVDRRRFFSSLHATSFSTLNHSELGIEERAVGESSPTQWGRDPKGRVIVFVSFRETLDRFMNREKRGSAIDPRISLV